jgi:hypothetical protein
MVEFDHCDLSRRNCGTAPRPIFLPKNQEPNCPRCTVGVSQGLGSALEANW